MAENSSSSPPTAPPPETPSAPDVRTEVRPDAPAAGRPGAPPAVFRKLVLWAGGAAAALAVIVAVMLGVQFVNNERSIRQIERVAVQPVVPAPAPAAVPPAGNTAVAIAPTGVPLAASTSQASAVPGPLPVGPAGADAVGAAPAAAAPEVVPPAPAKAEPVNASARKASAAKRVKKKSRAQDDTFKRCPPLGKQGAVMCRWHICNGGAGKERACRPYLERVP
jgi:hypothetical protein